MKSFDIFLPVQQNIILPRFGIFQNYNEKQGKVVKLFLGVNRSPSQ